MLSKVWDEFTYPFPNFNICTVEVWEWISDSFTHYTMVVVTYPCCEKENCVKHTHVSLFHDLTPNNDSGRVPLIWQSDDNKMPRFRWTCQNSKIFIHRAQWLTWRFVVLLFQWTCMGVTDLYSPMCLACEYQLNTSCFVPVTGWTNEWNAAVQLL